MPRTLALFVLSGVCLVNGCSSSSGAPSTGTGSPAPAQSSANVGVANRGTAVGASVPAAGTSGSQANPATPGRSTPGMTAGNGGQVMLPASAMQPVAAGSAAALGMAGAGAPASTNMAGSAAAAGIAGTSASGAGGGAGMSAAMSGGSNITGMLGALGPVQPVMAGWATTNGLETLVYLSTAPLTCAMMMTRGVRWLGMLPAGSQVIEIVVGQPAAVKSYTIGTPAAFGGGEVNYAEGSKSSSTEVTGSTGTITFTAANAKGIHEGMIEVTAPFNASGSFHAEWCEGGTEY